jgi:hypothetical protein
MTATTQLGTEGGDNMSNCPECGQPAEVCVCTGQELELYALVNGPAYRKTVGSSPCWMVLHGYTPMGTERYVEDGWEYIDGICCEVWRHPYGGLIAQPTKVTTLEAYDITPVEMVKAA